MTVPFQFDVWGCRGSRNLVPNRSSIGNRTSCYSILGPDSLVVLQEVEITVEARFPPTVRDPDLVVVNRSVVDLNPVRVDAADVALVVEIVSPGSRRTDRVMKLYEYAKAGIEGYWIVDLDADPDERFLAHLLNDGTYQRVDARVGDRVRTGEPVALDFALDELTQP